MARNSLYGSFLNQIPSWVTGGDYGQITSAINNREISFDNAAQERQRTLNNDMILQQQQQQQELNSALADIWASDQRPTNLRDMYGAVIDSAAQTGNPMTSIDAMAKLAALDEDAQKRKMIDLKTAIDLAPNLPYSRINELLPGALSQPEADLIRQAAQPRASGRAASTVEIDPLAKNVVYLLSPDGVPVAVPRSKYNDYIGANYVDPERSPPAAVLQAQARAAEKLLPAQDNGPGTVDSILSFFGGAKPGEQQSKDQKDLVDNLPGKVGANNPNLVGWRNRKTGEVQYLPKGEKPK